MSGARPQVAFSLGRHACRPALVMAAMIAVLPLPASAWGDRSHQLINRLAVETLPAQARAYFAPHADELARRAVEPDSVLRAKDGRAESVRHFIDLDAYGPAPFGGLPHSHEAAVRRFGRRTVEKRGLLPWAILRFERRLAAAIRDGEVSAVVREAAYLGHYVGDAYQPLHLTRNYDGQLSGTTGLHERFENALVDAGLDQYTKAVRRLMHGAAPLRHARGAIFEAMVGSYAEVETILEADRAARAAHRPRSREYAAAMDRRLAPVVCRQLANASSMLGALWLTAWERGRERRTNRSGE